MTDRTGLPQLMNRRAAIARLATLMGGTLIAGEFLLTGTRLGGKETTPDFSAADLVLLDEIGETILPATDTPGAKAAKVGEFMALIVRECYDERHEAIFRAGLKQLDADCRQQTGKSFLDASAAERTKLLSALNAQISVSPHQGGADDEMAPPHYVAMLRQLTIIGYFTSEIGCTQALRYNEVPGAYRGDVPYEPGAPAWFDTVARPVRLD